MSCSTQTLSTLLMMSRILALITMLRLRGPVPTFLARSAMITWQLVEATSGSSHSCLRRPACRCPLLDLDRWSQGTWIIERLA